LTKKLESLLVGGENETECGSWALGLNFKSPTFNFDRNLVKGRVLKLLKVKDDKFSLALEIGAGEKLFSIIVENEITASVLIKNNCFEDEDKVTLIPNANVKNDHLPKPEDFSKI